MRRNTPCSEHMATKTYHKNVKSAAPAIRPAIHERPMIKASLTYRPSCLRGPAGLLDVGDLVVVLRIMYVEPTNSNKLTSIIVATGAPKKTKFALRCPNQHT